MQLENLVRAGAFDTLEANRARLFAAAEAILRRAQATAEEKESGQIALFGAAPGAAREALRLPDMPDWPPMERLDFEAEAIGFHLTAHPLDAIRQGAAPARHDAVRAGGGERAGRASRACAWPAWWRRRRSG